MSKAAIACLVLAEAAMAQEEPITRVTVNEVRIDATVIGKKGVPVTDLGPGDFRVLQDRKRQTPIHVQYVAAPKPDASRTVNSSAATTDTLDPGAYSPVSPAQRPEASSTKAPRRSISPCFRHRVRTPDRLARATANLGPALLLLSTSTPASLLSVARSFCFPRQHGKETYDVCGHI